MEVYEAILTKRKEQSIKGFHIKQIRTLLNVFRLFQVHGIKRFGCKHYLFLLVRTFVIINSDFLEGHIDRDW